MGLIRDEVMYPVSTPGAMEARQSIEALDAAAVDAQAAVDKLGDSAEQAGAQAGEAWGGASRRLRDAQGRFIGAEGAASKAGAKGAAAGAHVAGAWRDANGRLRNAQGRFIKLGAAAGAAGDAAASAGGAAGRGFDGAAGHARDFRSELGRVGDAAGDAIEYLGRIEDIGRVLTGFAVFEIVEGVYEYGRALFLLTERGKDWERQQKAMEAAAASVTGALQQQNRAARQVDLGAALVGARRTAGLTKAGADLESYTGRIIAQEKAVGQLAIVAERARRRIAALEAGEKRLASIRDGGAQTLAEYKGTLREFNAARGKLNRLNREAAEVAERYNAILTDNAQAEFQANGATERALGVAQRFIAARRASSARTLDLVRATQALEIAQLRANGATDAYLAQIRAVQAAELAAASRDERERLAEARTSFVEGLVDRELAVRQEGAVKTLAVLQEKHRREARELGRKIRDEVATNADRARLEAIQTAERVKTIEGISAQAERRERALVDRKLGLLRDDAERARAQLAERHRRELADLDAHADRVAVLAVQRAEREAQAEAQARAATRQQREDRRAAAGLIGNDFTRRLEIERLEGEQRIALARRVGADIEAVEAENARRIEQIIGERSAARYAEVGAYTDAAAAIGDTAVDAANKFAAGERIKAGILAPMHAVKAIGEGAEAAAAFARYDPIAGTKHAAAAVKHGVTAIKYATIAGGAKTAAGSGPTGGGAAAQRGPDERDRERLVGADGRARGETRSVVVHNYNYAPTINEDRSAAAWLRRTQRTAEYTPGLPEMS